MSFSRNGVLAGESIELRVIVLDDTGQLRNTDAVPNVYIYAPDVDTETIEADIESGLFANAFAGPIVAVNISTGFYEAVFLVPDGSDEGVWHDVWVAELNTTPISTIRQFIVETGAEFIPQTPFNNNTLIIIELDESIADVTGDLTLGTDTILSFATLYMPFYASPELMRIEAGTHINYIPDDTLALMIHWSSKEADFIARKTTCKASNFDFARTKFVVYDAVLRSLTLPGSGFGSTGDGLGTRKQLGDLLIDLRGAVNSSRVPVTASGIDVETLAYVRSKRDEWFRVVNAGACIVPGQGFAPQFASKGLFDPDRRRIGRLWELPVEYNYMQPTTNAKVLRVGSRRWRYAQVENFEDPRLNPFYMPRRKFGY